jgi:hypothetical protein
MFFATNIEGKWKKNNHEQITNKLLLHDFQNFIF